MSFLCVTRLQLPVDQPITANHIEN